MRPEDIWPTAAAVSDDATTSTIHTALDAWGLLPKIHIADTGFMHSALLAEARGAQMILLAAERWLAVYEVAVIVRESGKIVRRWVHRDAAEGGLLPP